MPSSEIERLKARERLLADGVGEGLHVVVADLVRPKVEDRQRWQRAVFEDGGDDVDVCAVQALLCQIEPAVPAPSNRKLAQDDGFQLGQGATAESGGEGRYALIVDLALREVEFLVARHGMRV